MSLGRVHSDATIDFYGENGVLFAQGRPFSFKGLSWYGAEGPQGVLAGLTSTSMDSVFGFMSDEGFNAVRVLRRGGFVTAGCAGLLSAAVLRTVLKVAVKHVSLPVAGG